MQFEVKGRSSKSITKYREPCEMSSKILINKEKLASLSEDARLGVLVGVASHAPNNSTPTVVVGQCACVQSRPPLPALTELGCRQAPDWQATREVVARHFPAGCEVCGVWVRTGGDDSAQKIVEVLCQATDLLSLFKPGSSFLVVTMPTSSGNQSDRICCYTVDGGSHRTRLQEETAHSVEEYLVAHTRLLRVQASFTLHAPAATVDWKGLPLSPLLKRVQSPSTVFYLPSHRLLLDSQAHKHPDSNDSTLGNLLKRKDAQSTGSGNTPLLVEVLEDTSTDPNKSVTAPVLSYDPAVSRQVELALAVDVVALLELGTPVREVAEVLREGIAAQLRAMSDATLWKDSCLCSTAVYHFPLPTQHCPVTVVYPHALLGQRETLGDGQLLATREELHRTLGLPGDRPFLRTINRQCFTKPDGTRLINPHTAVKHTEVPGGSLALVQGSYSYYHYMQDRFNDGSWGCAYRSLQTLWSWFVLQGYTAKPVPSHRDIQQALVNVGDKEPSLVGSQQWIGSFEVSTCFNHLMGVLCKIHHCNSGAEMASVGRVLLHHFHTQGTPVMIGGGVLAHSILGVDFSESTGEIQFLILDPHYTGREDLRTIVDKGWCGWKPVTFWDQQAHYNLCMPLRPEEL